MFTIVADDESTPVASKRTGFDSGLKVDPEQVASYEKTIELLISGGYFRAMIQTLEPFDKIAGGLAWCITAANANVNIGLLFEEHSRMGEKVEMSENIERSLVDMKCPFQVQAQQILHLNCMVIYPVVQWLVNHLIEVRKATGDIVRVFSEKQFTNFSYLLPSDREKQELMPKGIDYLGTCDATYAAKRTHRIKKKPRYLRSSRRGAEFEVERVQTVLLEYGQGHLYTMALLQKKKEGEKKKGGIKIPGVDEDDEQRQKEAALAAEERGKKILRAMGVVGEDEAAVASQQLTDMLKSRSSENAAAAELAALELAEAARLQSEANVKEHGEFDHQRFLQDVEKRIIKCETRLAEIKQTYDEKKEELTKLRDEYTKKQNYNQKVIDETDKLKNQEQTPENKKNLEILQGMVALREDLKNQTTAFRDSVQKQKADWEARIEHLKNSEPQDELDEILAMWQRDSEKLEKARELNANKSRAVAAVKRKIDSVPSRRELQQYQRQFVEVYEQMGVKYTETKQYYNLFNSSTQIKETLEHERSLLDQVQRGFLQVKGNKKAKEKFATSMAQMVEEMTNKNLALQKRLNEKAIADRNTEDSKYQNLIERERQYYLTAKKFQEECKVTEDLQAAVSKLQKRTKPAEKKRSREKAADKA